MEKLKPILKPLHTTLSKYNSAIGDAESYLSQFIEFDFSIFYQPSDGFVVVDNDANNAALSSCLAIINEKWHLSHDDYLDVLI